MPHLSMGVTHEWSMHSPHRNAIQKSSKTVTICWTLRMGWSHFWWYIPPFLLNFRILWPHLHHPFLSTATVTVRNSKTLGSLLDWVAISYFDFKLILGMSHLLLGIITPSPRPGFGLGIVPSRSCQLSKYQIPNTASNCPPPSNIPCTQCTSIFYCFPTLLRLVDPCPLCSVNGRSYRTPDLSRDKSTYIQTSNLDFRHFWYFSLGY